MIAVVAACRPNSTMGSTYGTVSGYLACDEVAEADDRIGVGLNYASVAAVRSGLKVKSTQGSDGVVRQRTVGVRNYLGTVGDG